MRDQGRRIHHAIEMAITLLLVRGGGELADADAVPGSVSKMICRDRLEDEHE